ncbi:MULTISPECIES: UdgX family uracil-DNA binding protein [Streptomyces]|uniref:Type-4 uracil-DNA glycosylase n=1 Tax=Streptomyces venezuelae (strain ATCC 10712 / CBS 650.69 / DSM 40230 / JCM 4526 / NBRC 13096 / PD 04745) TaxID=953739 RepID=F2RHN4_STRVP|nr:UdgX family uracil-DNA binding protein [Streptomyces venezuelae]APE25376.1 uracil-DNA glycosylase [Streptomyces venezuelae]QES02715.1 uracil-DNA glycosylase [Streptomyces venezuelae ATCC 10712]CCA59978.1 Uracil-DNA glycosylase, putative family 6 [Streptomyces venezuelae ATCC 10712]
MAGTRDDDPVPEPYDATPFLPRRGGIPAHRAAAAGCQGCPLHRDATGTVFGRGDPHARLMLVGEQPGDQEDREGVPFVGPAGRLLSRALREAGIDEEGLYVTNAVKHFKFTEDATRKRRIHKAPSLRETLACRPWLMAELRLVSPELVVTLGATAGRALLGPSFRVGADRGVPRPLTDAGEGTDTRVLATVHPSAVLRARDRDDMYAGLVADLRVAADAL